MKCIINCSGAASGWVRSLMPGLPPYLIPLGNKPFLEFLLDFCVLSGIDKVRIVSDDPEWDWQSPLGNGERWNIELSYVPLACDLSATKLREYHNGFVDGDDLLVFHGLAFMRYDKRDFKMPKFDPAGWVGEHTPDGDGWSIIGRNAAPETEFENRYAKDGSGQPMVEPLDSVRKFYELNMALAYCDGVRYTMPGYSSEPNVYIGRNVVIARATVVTPPVILGDSTQLGRAAGIGPGAVIGNNSLVDDRATVIDSVVVGNSYIGHNLELRGKIVYRNTIIDPLVSEKFEIDDDSLLCEMVKPCQLRCSYKQRLMGAIFFALQLIPYLLLRPFAKLRSEKVECFVYQHMEKKRVLHLYKRPGRNFAARYFLKLNLDKFHLLPLVISGHLRLVGNYILPVTPENSKFMSSFTEYSPGLFSLSELLEHEYDPVQREIDELYYAYNASFRFNLEILQQSLLRNLMKRT